MLIVVALMCFIAGVTCTDPGTPAGGRQVKLTSYEVGELVFYECDQPGFQPDSPFPLECVFVNNNTVTWNSSVPTCVGKFKF